MIANRVNNINEPQTIAMAKAARALAAQGLDVINLSLGEPDFATPDFIKSAAVEAIKNNFTYYTPVAGIPELREAIAQKFRTQNNILVQPENIIVSTGAKHSIMNAFLAIINAGDEVIIPTPYWVSYSEMVKLIDGVPRFINSGIEQNFKITAEQLSASITAKTKAFIFSSPCNPTGSVYSEAELNSLAEVFIKHKDIIIISDEIYEHINFTGKHFSIGSIKELKDRVITINGLSKGFAMTGWRLGYMAAPIKIAQAVEKIQGQFTSGTNSITQKAAVAALTGPLQPTIEMCDAFKNRRNLVFERLNKIQGLKCNLPDGAFYFFPDVSYFFGKSFGKFNINNATDLSEYLLQNAHVSLVTGEAFGSSNNIRMSYATSEDKLIKACERIDQALKNLS